MTQNREKIFNGNGSTSSLPCCAAAGHEKGAVSDLDALTVAMRKLLKTLNTLITNDETWSDEVKKEGV